MKLFYAPGFSSIADHIAMLEAELQFDLVKVDIWTKQIEGGGSYTDINPKGYVPALMFDDGELLTENAAILAWVADHAPDLAPRGELGRYRLIEMLSFLASEIHKRFPIYFSVSEDSKPVLRDEILQRFGLLAGRLERTKYLFGDSFSVADPYLFMLARGAGELGFPLAECFRDYVARIETRPSVREAERREGISEPSSPQL
ncbi:glutathione S-transferase N-terminal domain-containing protein [Chelativorans sp. YIM 93263]|uniref:glutathione S-transferase N-terminal domain-containing protein n=1 Tax=Chelativorans sp. YIM 93263 TaxID=2906648 RepID=UPI0023790342|nr:glutathione S-transferase N-terminal domain-containing protein [Chelativorans sp. YIM 93263]